MGWWHHPSPACLAAQQGRARYEGRRNTRFLNFLLHARRADLHSIFSLGYGFERVLRHTFYRGLGQVTHFNTPPPPTPPPPPPPPPPRPTPLHPMGITFYQFGCVTIDLINLRSFYFPLDALQPNKFMTNFLPYFFKWPYLSPQMS